MMKSYISSYVLRSRHISSREMVHTLVECTFDPTSENFVDESLGWSAITDIINTVTLRRGSLLFQFGGFLVHEEFSNTDKKSSKNH